MRKLGWLFAVCLMLMSSFSLTQMSEQEVANLMRVGRKAFYSFYENSDVRRVTKFGFNKDIDSAGIEVLASFGGTWQQYALSAETLTVVSALTETGGGTPANDTSAGTGARTILIGCIDENGLEVEVTVTMNGTTPVVTTQTCKFINRATVLTAGSSKMNTGDINITQTTSGVQLARIPADKSVTQQLLYYVPADRRCYIDDVFVKVRKLSGGGDPKVEVNMRVYSQTQDVLYDIREYFIDTSAGDGIINQLDFKAEPLRPNEIITLEFDTNVNDTIATGSIDLTCKID